MTPSVLVLLATYNGEKYLSEQIDSILNQKDVNVYIKVADDRSLDSTHSILEEYKKTYPNFDYSINEKNKGFTYNFIDLLFSVKDLEYDYYAFSDQDDFWLDCKLIKAIDKLKEKNNNGCLYCSNLTLADQNLEAYAMQESKKILKYSKYTYLTSNIATGCTIVFDNKFCKQATKVYPTDIYLHDYWLLLIAAFTADYIYDENSYILYRQHTNNQIGSNKSFFNKKKINNFFHPKHPTSLLLNRFLSLYYNDIYPSDIKYVTTAAKYKESFKNKQKLLFSRKIRRRKFNFFFKIKIILNKF